jgi:hypothetical protein
MNQDHQDVYLEPAVEINRESVDPLAASDAEAVSVNICISGC